MSLSYFCYGCPNETCLGMEYNEIVDDRMTEKCSSTQGLLPIALVEREREFKNLSFSTIRESSHFFLSTSNPKMYHLSLTKVGQRKCFVLYYTHPPHQMYTLLAKVYIHMYICTCLYLCLSFRMSVNSDNMKFNF